MRLAAEEERFNLFEAASRDPLSAIAQKSLTALDFISIFATRSLIIALYEIYIKTHNVAIAKRIFSCFCLKWIILAAFFLEGVFFSCESGEVREIFGVWKKESFIPSQGMT